MTYSTCGSVANVGSMLLAASWTVLVFSPLPGLGTRRWLLPYGVGDGGLGSRNRQHRATAAADVEGGESSTVFEGHLAFALGALARRVADIHD